MLERHIEHYGVSPAHVAVDGGCASMDGLIEAKDKGVEEMVFHKQEFITYNRPLSIFVFPNIL